MTIAAILAHKGPEVVSTDAGTTVQDAVRLLAERRIGALPVLDNGEVAGIISERDVVYCLSRDGESVLHRPVREVMSAPTITVERNVSVLAALSEMTRRRIRHLPVVEGGELIGIVSIGDLVAYRIRKIEEEAEAMRAYIQGS
jgi:CBS domain-containing protein